MDTSWALLVGAGQVAVLAIEQVAVGTVLVPHDLEPVVGLPAQVGVREVVADERRTHRPPQFLDRPVCRMPGPATGEAPQDLIELSGAQPQCGGVLTIWSYYNGVWRSPFSPSATGSAARRRAPLRSAGVVLREAPPKANPDGLPAEHPMKWLLMYRLVLAVRPHIPDF